VKHTDYEAPHYTVFSSLITTSSLLGPNIILSTLFLNTLIRIQVFHLIHYHSSRRKFSMYDFMLIYISCKIA